MFARRLQANAKRAGITARMIEVGRSTLLLRIAPDDGRVGGIIRVGDHPEHVLRDNLRRLHVEIGWHGRDRIADLRSGGRDDTASAPVLDATIAMLPHFGMDSAVRDRLYAKAVHHERYTRSARNRVALRGAWERVFAERAAVNALAGIDSSLVAEVIGAAAAAHAIGDTARTRTEMLTWRIFAERLPPSPPSTCVRAPPSPPSSTPTSSSGRHGVTRGLKLRPRNRFCSPVVNLQRTPASFHTEPAPAFSPTYAPCSAGWNA